MILIRRFELPMWRFDNDYLKYNPLLKFLERGYRLGIHQFYYNAISIYLTLPNTGVPNSDFAAILEESVTYNYDYYMDMNKLEPDLSADFHLRLITESFASDFKDLMQAIIPMDNCMFRNLIWTNDNRYFVDIEVY